MDRRKVTVAVIALTSFLFCGFNGPQQCQTKSDDHSKAIIITAVAVAATGTAVAIGVHTANHNIKGCVTSDKDGLHLQEGDTARKYVLSGATPGIKEGDLVRVHGSKVKKAKGVNSDQIFVVDQLKKDYGLCTAQPAVDTTKP
jgi:hypothetical protein